MQVIKHAPTRYPISPQVVWKNPCNMTSVVEIRQTPILVFPAVLKEPKIIDTLDSIMAGKIAPYYRNLKRLILNQKTRNVVSGNDVFYENGCYYVNGETLNLPTKFIRTDKMIAWWIKYPNAYYYLTSKKTLLNDVGLLRHIHILPNDITLLTVPRKTNSKDKSTFPNHVFKFKEAEGEEKQWLLKTLKLV